MNTERSQPSLTSYSHEPEIGISRKSTIKEAKKPIEIYIPLYEVSWPNALRWRGSVLPRVYPKLIFFTLFSTLITCVHKLVPVNLGIPSSLITILGLVTGLLLVFRTNTAYDRFWEGRRLWSSLVTHVRNLNRLIWVGVRGKEPRDIIEKKSACNLLVAFSIACKHYLREEYGIGWTDLHDYLSHIPKYAIPSSIEPFEKLKSKLSSREGITKASTSNLPLETTIYLSAYLQYQLESKKIDPPLLNVMVTQLNGLLDCLTGFERILRTPIPLAYSIHLSQTVWAYCLALPFQLVQQIGWVTIPVTVISAFTLFGIESIGGEIENPFGYDDNDLPLDDFCEVIAAEVHQITSQHPPSVEDWVYDRYQTKTKPEENPVEVAEHIIREQISSNPNHKI